MPQEYALSSGESCEQDELVALYTSVGWTSYTSDPALLECAIAGSTYVVTARKDGELVGLARVISDGASIAYLQDVLVHPEHRRRGLASALVAQAFLPFESVRQKVLLTDAEPGQRAFYESLGLTEIRDLPGDGLRAFVRM